MKKEAFIIIICAQQKHGCVLHTLIKSYENIAAYAYICIQVLRKPLKYCAFRVIAPHLSALCVLIKNTRRCIHKCIHVCMCACKAIE